MFLPANGGFPTKASKARVPALEHLRELDLPVERRERHGLLAFRGEVLLVGQNSELLRIAVVQKRREVLLSAGLPPLRLCLEEERLKRQIAEEPHIRQRRVRIVQLVSKFPLVDVGRRASLISPRSATTRSTASETTVFSSSWGGRDPSSS